jgi:hypothetical protein
MTIQNQFLAIPPDHPLAKEFYDLEIAQSTIIEHLNPTSLHFNAAKVDEYSKALALVDARIGFLQNEIRQERGGDETCTVGLTYGANGFPIVAGRASNGTPVLMSGKPILMVVSDNKEPK